MSTQKGFNVWNNSIMKLHGTRLNTFATIKMKVGRIYWKLIHRMKICKYEKSSTLLVRISTPINYLFFWMENMNESYWTLKVAKIDYGLVGMTSQLKTDGFGLQTGIECTLMWTGLLIFLQDQVTVFLWILIHGNGLTPLAKKRQLFFVNSVIMHSHIVLVVYVVLKIEPCHLYWLLIFEVNFLSEKKCFINLVLKKSTSDKYEC